MRLSIILASILLVVVFLLALLPRTAQSSLIANDLLPATSLMASPAISSAPQPSVSVRPIFSGLGEFASRVTNGHPGQVVGVYVENQFAFPVIQQPQGQPAFVSDQDELVTQFELATNSGIVGLLAHNYLSGSQFFDLKIDAEIVLLYGDGNSEIYQVTSIQRFQALEPASPYSQFIDQSDPTQKVISSAALFNRIYTTPDRMVLQTCIDANGDASWGRLFVIAERISSIQILLPAEPARSNN